MINIDSRVRLFLFVEPCDMRRQIDSLLGIVGAIRGEPAAPGALYIFMNRRRTYVRLLFLDSTGVCLFSKRLFKGSLSMAWATGLSLDSRVPEVTTAVLAELINGSRG